jgi:hypothetical protein
MTDDQLAPPPAPRVTVQCKIPTRTADLLDLSTITLRARAAGVEGIAHRPALEATTHRTGYGQTLLTMSMPVAVWLLEEVRAKGAAETRANELLGYAAAFKSLDAAILDALAFAASGSGGRPVTPPTISRSATDR